MRAFFVLCFLLAFTLQAANNWVFYIDNPKEENIHCVIRFWKYEGIIAACLGASKTSYKDAQDSIDLFLQNITSN